MNHNGGARNKSSSISTPKCAECFDKAELLSRVAEDRECLLDLIRTFIEECDSMMFDIQTAIARSDCAMLQRAAHKLKGSVGIFAAKAAFETAFELEQVGQSCQTDHAQEIFVRLETQIAIFKRALLEYELELCGPKS
jgi:HPt (histidine-containing phosphotransfer) domain-containing protein